MSPYHPNFKTAEKYPQPFALEDGRFSLDSSSPKMFSIGIPVKKTFRANAIKGKLSDKQFKKYNQTLNSYERWIAKIKINPFFLLKINAK